MPVPDDLDARLAATLPRFTGEVRQVPPMASAIKVGGEPLHRLRRAGKVVARPERTVFVHRLTLLEVSGPLVDLRIECSKGTYIRTLAADLAEALGTCGSLAELRRERIGQFTLEDAVASDELATSHRDAVLGRAGMTLNEALAHLPGLNVEEDAAYAVRHGVMPRRGEIRGVEHSLAPGDRARLLGPDGELVAVVVARERLAESEFAQLGDGRSAEEPAPLEFWRVLAGHGDD
jgi:tRNA pseudouridine55 synthase